MIVVLLVAAGAARYFPFAPVVRLAGDAGPFRTCDEVRAAGLAPAGVGSPGYALNLDRDRDGIACEPWLGGGSEPGQGTVSVVRGR